MSKTMLIMEDEQELRQLLRAFLEDAGYDDLPRQEAPVDLSRLTARLCRSLAGVAEDRAQHFEVALSEAVVVSGEAALLEKAFSNIIGNAIFHSPPGAQICVKLEMRDEQRRPHRGRAAAGTFSSLYTQRPIAQP